MKFILLLTMMIAFAISGCGLVKQGADKYDLLVDRDEKCMQAWADIDAQLVRRSDLIPNLVATVQGYATHEQTTLREVMEARASATQVKMEYKQGVDDFSDPAKMAAFQASQNGLSQAMGKLMVVREAYPELKANQQFNTLMGQIESTENRILQARRVYNETVGQYNTELRHISGRAINPITNMEFKPRAYFTADADARIAPKINFNTAPAGSK